MWVLDFHINLVFLGFQKLHEKFTVCLSLLFTLRSCQEAQSNRITYVATPELFWTN
jgi:hypothetical protein